MTETFWSCTGNPPATPPCGQQGQYIHAAKTGNSGPAYQHVRDTRHSVITATRDWVWGVAA